MTEQILVLGELHNTYHQERNTLDRNSFDFAILKREESKVATYRRVYEHKLRERERILAVERLTFDIQPESEDSDGGYSEIEGFVENQEFVTNKIRKRRKRQPKPKAEDFIQENIERRERERRENYIRQQAQIAAEVAQNQNLFESESESEEEEGNMANQLRWSVQSVSKFHGDSGQSATQHLYEFDDFLRAAGIVAPEEGGDAANVAHIINDFVTTLKGKARVWFDMNVPEDERTTRGEWNVIRDKFKAYFHPLGSTKEQRIRAWKDMRWDPIKEAIDDFAYRYKELGLSLGLQQDSIFDNFKACIPGQYFVFVYNANDMAQAVDNLKKCIAAGPMVPSTTIGVSVPTTTTTTTTQKDDKMKFMAMTEETHQEIFNQLQDTIDERLGPMEEGMYETKDMIDQVYQMISQGQQNQGQMRFNSNQGQNNNRFGQNQNRFNRGRGQTQNFGQKRGGQNNFNRNGGNNREVFCTFCKRYRHQVGNCIALKAELRKRGYRIANNTNGFGNGSNGGQRNGGQPNRGGANNRGGKNGFQNRNGGRSGFQDRMNCMNEEDCDDDYDNDMNDEELFMCCISEFQENTGLEVVPYEESN